MKYLAAALLATTCLVAPSSARAEPISTFIGLTAAISSIGIGAATAGAIGGAIVSIGLSVGVSVLSSMLKKGTSGEPAGSSSGQDLSVQYGADLARTAFMGPGATGGHHVYTNVYGNENIMMQLVYVLGDGHHGKLTRLRYNGKDCTLPAGGVVGDGHVVVIPEFVDSNNSTRVVIRYFDGRYDQAADPALVANANPAGRWTTDHRGRGVAYLSIDQAYHEELQLTGLPQILAETEGLRLYDPRKDSTNGGSGPHRWGDTNTYEPSSNPAIQEYNFRRGVLVNGQRILGMSITPVNLLLQMYFAAANINDEAVPLAGGGTEPRYRCSINCSDDRAASDVLGAIRAATAGWTLERGGQFGPIPGVPQIPDASLAFTDDDLIVGERASFTKYRSRSELVTSVHGRFSDPAQFWVPASFPAREDPADDAAMGEKLARDMDLTQVYSASQAQRIAESERRRTLQQGQGSVTLPAKWIGVQPGDWLNYNSVRHGNMTVLITNAQMDVRRHVVTLAYEKTSNTVYSWTTAGELFPPDVGAPAVPGFIIMSASGMTATGVNLPGDNGLVTPGIAFAWTPILDPSVDQIDFEIRKLGDSAILPFTAEFPSSGSAVCSGHGIAAATSYEYRHKLYTTPVRNTPWSAWATVLSGTQHVVPSALAAIPIDEVTLQMFEDGLRDYVANQLHNSSEELDRIQQLIASEATEQDAQNWLEKQAGKGALTTVRAQVSAQYGATWRGDWDPTAHYEADDQVEHDGALYYTPVATFGTEPPAAPWVHLLTTAKISEGWTTFAGADGAAASTSDRIEARFKGGPDNDLPTNVANIITQWAAFAGPDYVTAQTSDSIESRFGSPTPKSLSQITSEWNTFAGPEGATTSTRQQLVAAIDGSSATIEGSATAVATLSGVVGAQYTLTLNANGYVSGFKLVSTGSTSAFVIQTDSFQIATAGVTAPQTVFQIGTSGGVSKVVMKGDMVADGTITASALAAGSVTAVKMAAQAIAASNIIADNVVVTGHLVADSATVLNTSTFSGPIFPSGAGQTMLMGNVNVLGRPSGGAGVVLVNISFAFDGPVTVPPVMEFLVDGSQVTTFRQPKHAGNPGGDYTGPHSTFATVVTLGAGSHAFAIRAPNNIPSGGGNQCFIVGGVLSVMESRR